MRNGKCPKCSGTKIGRFENVLDVKTNNSEAVQIRNREFKRLGSVSEKTGFLSSETKAAEVEAFVCTECGYLEEYVKDPGGVPWEKLSLFSWVKPG